jgi:hypothetical protein
MRRPSPFGDGLPDQLAVLTRERPVRLLNCSVSGCLLETHSPFLIGTIASIRVNIEGRDLTDDVQIVRCQPIAGAGDTYHVGAQFLWTQPLTRQSLRSALRLSRGELSGTVEYLR